MPTEARMASQSAEFDAMRELAEQWRRITMTPIVDDDYPQVRFEYERALEKFLDACQKNGRLERYERGAPVPAASIGSRH